MKNKYRIVEDNYNGFEVQIKKWWYPFWIQCDVTNTHSNLKKAKEFIRIHKKRKIFYQE